MHLKLVIIPNVQIRYVAAFQLFQPLPHPILTHCEAQVNVATTDHVTMVSIQFEAPSNAIEPISESHFSDFFNVCKYAKGVNPHTYCEAVLKIRHLLNGAVMFMNVSDL